MKYTQRRLLIMTGCFVTINLTACSDDRPGALPPVADVQAVVEMKPRPPVEILTDPAASAKHDAAIEAWGDKISAAGKRLCGFFRKQGMQINC